MSDAQQHRIDTCRTPGFPWVRVVFYVHLGAVVCSAVVVRSSTILSNKTLELLIAMPLLLSFIAFPAAMVLLVRRAKGVSEARRRFAVVGDAALSAVQFLTWLPTFQ